MSYKNTRPPKLIASNRLIEILSEAANNGDEGAQQLIKSIEAIGSDQVILTGLSTPTANANIPNMLKRKP